MTVQPLPVAIFVFKLRRLTAAAVPLPNGYAFNSMLTLGLIAVINVLMRAPLPVPAVPAGCFFVSINSIFDSLVSKRLETIQNALEKLKQEETV